jgi:hypothetical protein
VPPCPTRRRVPSSERQGRSMRGQKVRLQAAADMRHASGCAGRRAPQMGEATARPRPPLPTPPPGGGERHTVPVTSG